MADVGEAIALGTRATPYRGMPITTGLRLLAADELHQAQLEAKRAAKEKAAADKLATMFTYSIPKVNQMYQADVRKIGEDAVQGVVKAGTPQEKAGIEMDTKLNWENYASKTAHRQDLMRYHNSKENLSYDPVSQMAKATSYQQNQDAFKKITPEAKRLLSGVFDFDESDPNEPMPVVTSPTKRLSLQEQADTDIRYLTQMQEADLLEKKGDFQVISQRVRKPQLATRAASTVEYNPAFADNLIVQNMDKAEPLLKKFDAEHPDVPDEVKRKAVATEIYTDILDARKVTKYGLRSLKDEGLSLGDGFATVNDKIYNFGTVDANQAQPALVAAGIMKYESDPEFSQGKQKFPAMSPPAITSGNILNEKGDQVYLDNITVVNVPHTNEWYAIGQDQFKVPSAVKITNTTVGPVASLYKLPVPTLKQLMQQTLDYNGVKQKVNLSGGSASTQKKVTKRVPNRSMK